MVVSTPAREACGDVGWSLEQGPGFLEDFCQWPTPTLALPYLAAP